MPTINVSLFSQLLSLIDRNTVARLIHENHSDKHHKGINTWTHLVSMMFCHLAKANSVREIANGLRSATGNLNHLGVQHSPCKSSVSYINKHRSWFVFRDIYFGLLERMEPSVRMRRQYAHRLKRKIYLMDSTLIHLCLSLFDWAGYRQRKGAVKLHTILDYDTCLPVFVHLTDGRTNDIRIARDVNFPKGSIIVMDRAYADFQWLYNLDSTGCFFVTRLKSNVQFELLEDFATNEKQEYILSDEHIRLTGFYAAKKYPGKLRVVKVFDEKYNRRIILLTNQMSWTADTISQLYKARWDIEVFFKHIKQVLKIKTFIGTTPNAVLIQVWTAMIVILLLKYLQAKSSYDWHLSNLVGFLRINLFVKIDLWKWINEPFVKIHDPPIQPELFQGDSFGKQ